MSHVIKRQISRSKTNGSLVTGFAGYLPEMAQTKQLKYHLQLKMQREYWGYRSGVPVMGGYQAEHGKLGYGS